MSEEVKDTANESEDLVVKIAEGDGENDNKIFSIFLKLMARTSLLCVGAWIFIFAFHKATQISEFNTTKMMLFELCLLIIFMLLICMLVVMALMRYKCTAKRVLALTMYIAALSSIAVFMVFWTFFKMGSI